VGLDIGTSKIAAIVAEIKPDGGFEIIGMGNSRRAG
jgi:cell division protein FtsA